jgi:hypothetical protein
LIWIGFVSGKRQGEICRVDLQSIDGRVQIPSDRTTFEADRHLCPVPG